MPNVQTFAISSVEDLIGAYRFAVQQVHPDKVHVWPILTGYNFREGRFGKHVVLVLEHTGDRAMSSAEGIGELHSSAVGFQTIDRSNQAQARINLERYFQIKPTDGIIIFQPGQPLTDEIQALLYRHEIAMLLTPMKIFLSHKGADKPLVRSFRDTLKLLGFDPWLDEDAMTAGAELERGILKGFHDSCAAVFFVTPHFKDAAYLASEIDYAIAEKRTKGDRFAIITLLFKQAGVAIPVPDLLRRYVWKEPSTDLEALREVIKALPIQVGPVVWKPHVLTS